MCVTDNPRKYNIYCSASVYLVHLVYILQAKLISSLFSLKQNTVYYSCQVRTVYAAP